VRDLLGYVAGRSRRAARTADQRDRIPISQIHEFMMLSFNGDVEDAEQLSTMRALDGHLGGCTCLISREYFRGVDGRRVEHVVWANREAIEAAAHLDDDPVVAALFERFDADTVSYACGERVGPVRLGASSGTDGTAVL
jgi:hypothetical protein